MSITSLTKEFGLDGLSQGLHHLTMSECTTMTQLI